MLFGNVAIHCSLQSVTIPVYGLPLHQLSHRAKTEDRIASPIMTAILDDNFCSLTEYLKMLGNLDGCRFELCHTGLL